MTDMLNTTTDTYRAFFSELEKLAGDWKGLARNTAIGAALGGYSGSKVDKEQHGKRNALIGAALGGALGAGSGKAVTNLHTKLRNAPIPSFQRAGEHVQKYQPFYEGAAAAKGGLKASATIGLGTWAGKKLGLIGNANPAEKSAEIMPPDAAHVKKTSGSPVTRGPRLPAGGRTGTTTAHPFSGNKTKIAGWGHAALGLGAMAGGGVIAHRALRRPFHDEFAEHYNSHTGERSSTEHFGPAKAVQYGIGSPTLRAIKHLRQKRQFAQQSQLAESPYGAGQAAY